MQPKKHRTIRLTERDTNRIISRRLWEARAVTGLSLAQLSEKTGISYITLHQYEQGVGSIMPWKLKTVAEALEVSISYFFEPIAKDEADHKRPSRLVLDFMRRLQQIERHDEVLFRAICDMVKTMAKTVKD